MPSRRPSVLYISYTGMLEALGQSQVLAYQEHLATDYDVHIISFERPSDWADFSARSRLKARMSSAGISWHPLPYHQRYSIASTSWDILAAIRLGRRLARTTKFEIIHARSYVASVAGLALKRPLRAKFIFDMRGFWPDERVDGGLWPRNGQLYRIAKRFERKFLLQSDHVVSLTHAAVREIQTFPYLTNSAPSISVIPTCTDLERFSYRQRNQTSPLTVGYVGSAGTWYRFDIVARAFQEVLQLNADARFLVINKSEHALITKELAANGIPQHRVELKSVPHADVPFEMSKMDLGVFFIKPAFSKLASAPTRLGEFLGCGIPCLTNAGIGDAEEVLAKGPSGVTISSFDPRAISEGVRQSLELAATPGVHSLCSRTARDFFSLDEGVNAYHRIYDALIQSAKSPSDGVLPSFVRGMEH